MFLGGRERLEFIVFGLGRVVLFWVWCWLACFDNFILVRAFLLLYVGFLSFQFLIGSFQLAQMMSGSAFFVVPQRIFNSG